MRTGPLVDPRERLQLRVEAEPKEGVPGRVELDLVDPLAVAVVRQELRRVLVREAPPLQWLAAENLAERGDLLLPGSSPLAS